MFNTEMNEKIKTICRIIEERLEKRHIASLTNENKKLLLISEQYPGVWLEHTYDAVLYAKMKPEAKQIAKNTIELFIDNQREDGQLPYSVKDASRIPGIINPVGFSQIQECVSFGKLCLEVYELTRDRRLLQKSYTAVKKWVSWLKNNRMTRGTGLVEMFVGFDTGHDNSGRLEGLSYPKSFCQEAFVLPKDDVAPIIAVDMNCNYYATAKALEKMAEILNLREDASYWKSEAENIKKLIFEICYDEEDAFFYDVDKNNCKRKYLSSTIFHLFMERVLDKEKDSHIIDEIYTRHIKNPDEFWTEYPFPSMAASDKSFKKRTEFNCWGYFSQGLIAQRCILWMDYYGMGEDFDVICEKWLRAWTNYYGKFNLGQELDPFTGEPSVSSEWYSSCMLFYLYAASRMRIYSFET